MVIRHTSSVQDNSSSHHSSFKKVSQRTGVANQSRFGMPDDISTATELVQGNCKVNLKRSARNVNLNEFNAALLLALRSNHGLYLRQEDA